MTRITRVEVIDENGRSYVNWKEDNDITLSYQDDGRTLKVFVNTMKPKSPAEEAYYAVYGWYPPTTSSVSNYEDNRWSVFQAGYNASKVSETPQEPEDDEWTIEKLQEKNWYVDTKTLLKSKEPEKEQQIKELVRESLKWCEEHPDESVEDYLKPQTPEQVADGLKEAFREAVKQGVVSSSNKPQTLYDLIAEWWEYLEDTLDMDSSIKDLVNDIEEWLPKEQSAAGSQNAYVECSVEGFNDCLNKIKSKLRNKKDT